MKRSQLKRTPWKSHGYSWGLKRSRLRVRKYSKKPTADGASLRELKDEMDGLVRTIIAIRDSKCVTCWAHSNLHVGHLFRRGVESVRWSLRNCHAQCDPCNGLHETEPEHYITAFIQRYGKQAYSELRDEANKRGKFTYTELLSIRDGLRANRDGLLARRAA